MHKTSMHIIPMILAVLGLLLLIPAASAAGQGDWLIRARIINVDPNDDSSSVSTLAGSEVSVDDDTTIEFDFTYMMTPNIGLELIAAVSEHDISGEKSIKGLGRIASSKMLPPTLTV